MYPSCKDLIFSFSAVPSILLLDWTKPIVISLVAARMTKGKKNEYFDKKGTEHVAAALPQTQEEKPEEKKLHNEIKDCECGCK